MNLFYTEREFVTGICYLIDESNSGKDAEKLLPLNNNSSK